MCDLPASLSLPLAFWSPGPTEMMIIAAVALLLYGGKLPEVARSWGKSLAEFRRGLAGIQHDLNDVIYSAQDQLEYYPEQESCADEKPDEKLDEKPDEKLDDSDGEENDSQEEAETKNISAGDTSTDTDSTAEPSSEKRTDSDAD